MSKQPEALQLADIMDAGQNFYAESSISFDFKLSNAVTYAAVELRRLHAVNAELLEALQRIATAADGAWCNVKWVSEHARAAIAKAAGEQL